MIQNLTAGLLYLHNAGVLHRDVSMKNILVNYVRNVEVKNHKPQGRKVKLKDCFKVEPKSRENRFHRGDKTGGLTNALKN